jgi:hypothetical protein
MHESDIWICVIDQAKARFLRCTGLGSDIEPMMCEDLGTCGHGYHHDVDEYERLIVRVANRLERAASDHLFERLVLVAPPPTLQKLRGSLNPTTSSLVIGEVAEDLARATPGELATFVGPSLQH